MFRAILYEYSCLSFTAEQIRPVMLQLAALRSAGHSIHHLLPYQTFNGPTFIGYIIITLKYNSSTWQNFSYNGDIFYSSFPHNFFLVCKLIFKPTTKNTRRRNPQKTWASMILCVGDRSKMEEILLCIYAVAWVFV